MGDKIVDTFTLLAPIWAYPPGFAFEPPLPPNNVVW